MASLKPGGLAMIFGLRIDTFLNGRMVTLTEHTIVKSIDGWFVKGLHRPIATYALHPIDPNEELIIQEYQTEKSPS